jgi:hypothetical protein
MYDLTTGVWTTSNMIEPRTLTAAVAIGNNKFLIAGGLTYGNNSTNKIERYTVAPLAAPAAPTNFSATLILNSTSAQLVWSPVSNATKYTISYKFDGNNTWFNDTICGSDTSFVLTELAANSDYNLQIVACNKAGCSTATSISLLTTNLGIEEALSSTQFYVYPNPASSAIELKIINGKVNGNIQIVNAVGQIVYSKVYSGSAGNINVNVSDFPKGLYTVLLSAGNQKLERMAFIKQ